jgi:hypothetical protein
MSINALDRNVVAITVDIRNEQGGLVQRETEGSFELAAALSDLDDGEYPMLRFVDAYGTTYFSSIQMIAVIPELERLATARPLPALDKVLEMARRVRAKPHTFLSVRW